MQSSENQETTFNIVRILLTYEKISFSTLIVRKSSATWFNEQNSMTENPQTQNFVYNLLFELYLHLYHKEIQWFCIKLLEPNIHLFLMTGQLERCWHFLRQILLLFGGKNQIVLQNQSHNNLLQLFKEICYMFICGKLSINNLKIWLYIAFKSVQYFYTFPVPP